MAASDYDRRDFPGMPAGNSIFKQGPGDHNPLYGSDDPYCLRDSYENPMRSSGEGPRPLEWALGGPAAFSRQSTTTSSGFIPQYGHLATVPRYSQSSTGLEYITHRNGGSYVAARPVNGVPGLQQPRVRTSAEAVAGYTPAVMGPEIAGYKSVVTKNPVSPSGYSLAPQQRKVAADKAGATYAASHSASSTGRVSYYSGRPAANPTVGMTAGQTHTPGARSTAAAAAALAALNGSKTRSTYNQGNALAPEVSNTDTSSYSSGRANGAYVSAAGTSYSTFDSYSAGEEYNYSHPATPCDTGRPAALNWKLPGQPPCSPNPGISHAGTSYTPIAGRRAAPATTAGGTPTSRQVTADSSSSYVPSSSSSAGQRPPSQQRSEGLSKLKQLASARLVNRITTPPTEDLAASATAATAVRRTSRRASSAVSTEDLSKPAGYMQSQRQEHGQQQQQQQQQQGPRVATGYQPSNYTDRTSNQTNKQNSSTQQVGIRSRRVALPQKQQVQRIQPAQDTGYPQSVIACSNQAAQDRFDEAASMAGAQPAADEDCQQCPSCGRRFIASAYEKHVKICDKVFGQKRKAFNMQQQRLQNTEAAKYSNKAASGGPASSNRSGTGVTASQQQQRQQTGIPPKAATSRQLDSRPAVSAAAAKKSRWQQQSEQLRAAMRAAHAGSGSASDVTSGSGSAFAAPQEADDRVPCPHCGRKFAELVAERHIPKCAEIIAKPKGLRAGGGKAAYMRSNSRQGR